MDLWHAEAPGRETQRSVDVRGVGPGRCVIRVVDDGQGFDPGQVPMSRIGLRVSIAEPMANAGGSAGVVSVPGAGTTITLAWPAGVEGSLP